MTYPPSGPAGQPGPPGMPSGAGPFAPQGGFPPGTRQLPPPPQQFDPWGQPPGAFEAYGSLEGPVAPRPKKRTGLIAGIAVGAVVVVGGGVAALVLLTRSGGSEAPAPGSPASVAQQAVAAFNSRDAQRYASLLCTTPSLTDVTKLQRQWTAASDLHGSMSGSPRISGSTATAQVSVSYNGSTQSTTIPMRQQGQKWCIDGS
ncbi:Rv0361 family membrane protein [Amycolatopsis alkalitolerans]|uniref:DUF4878 domain-containing protein n=1 Tax=Amycolatopsis alkalitolerans TaxID=2547244 RepID=A0A5C4M551_9PSEU|nr:hypothetical protein [Amycolatopsis alkalitolerans]TNC25430.1 hypothetical protein FG385_15215 [Amycolatopsis alkalitolerans]